MSLPKVGDFITETRFVNESDVQDFARVSGDINPIHLDDAYAAKTRFKKRIAHGMIAASFVSKIVGTRFPGYGSIYVSQTYKFRNPIYIGDSIVAEIRAIAVREDKPIVTLSTICRNQNGDVLLEGEAVVFYEPV